MPLFPDDPKARRQAAAQSIRDVGQRPPASNRKTQSRGNTSDDHQSKENLDDTSGGTSGGGGRISALRPTNRDPLRSTIKVDGRAVGTLSQKLIDDLNLTIGSPFTPELAAAVADAVVYDKAFRKATRALARRAMSSGMIRQKLRTPPRPRKPPLGQDGKPDHTRKPREPDPVPPAAVIDQVLARLAELQLLDDRAFGQALIRDLTRAKPAGPMLLKQKLFAKGLDAKLIDELVAEATADPDEQADGATAFARKKFRSMQHLDPAVIKRRLYGQLARRGFTPDAIRTALDAVLKETPDNPFD
ncbi:MAG: regulatory protein RecX [Planctomycetota bacterium]